MMYIYAMIILSSFGVFLRFYHVFLSSSVVHSSFRPSMCPSVCPYVCLFGCASVCLSVRLSECLQVSVSRWRYINNQCSFKVETRGNAVPTPYLPRLCLLVYFTWILHGCTIRM